MKIAAEYIRGFVDGEGSFVLSIQEKPRKTKKIQVMGMFAITQTGDSGRRILEEIKRFLQCGKVYSYNRKKEGHTPVSRLFVFRIDDLMTKIIPFFDAHPPVLKKEVYSIWRKAITIIKASSIESELPYHALTEENMQTLFQLKLRMEELIPSARSPKHRRGRWRQHIKPSRTLSEKTN
jgi:hypothetical protein